MPPLVLTSGFVDAPVSTRLHSTSFIPLLDPNYPTAHDPDRLSAPVHPTLIDPFHPNHPTLHDPHLVLPKSTCRSNLSLTGKLAPPAVYLNDPNIRITAVHNPKFLLDLDYMDVFDFL
ncbi:hypothetical protein PAMP_004386 [Pampus punctatissimus]